MTIPVFQTVRNCSLFLALFLPSAVGAPAASGQTPILASVQKKSDGVTMITAHGALRLQVWSDRIIRVTYVPGKGWPTLNSFSVIGQPAKTRWTLTETPEALALKTDSLQVQVDSGTGVVRFYDLHGNLLLREAARDRPLAADGSAAGQSFVLAPDERIYGLGQHQSGAWNYRGTAVHLQQENREVAVPVLLSSKGYGVLWDNPAITDVDVGKASAGILSWTSEAGNAVDYYFLYGPTPDGAIQDYRALTGAAPMMGRWVWGFWQCKERYASQEELTNVVAEYRRRGVPLDGIIQDWQYWPTNGWGSHAFDRARYPDPPAMLRELHAMNAHALISVWAKFDRGTANFSELEHAGALYPEVLRSVYPPGWQKWYDAFNPAARRLYWNEINRELFQLGIDGWWLDASEPELSGKWGEFRTFPTADGPGANVFNAYPLMHTAGIYQGQRGATSQKRVCILTRSAWAGQQRNAAITWSGDIHGRWSVLAKQIPAGLNFSISGIPYWNTDIGGFFDAKLNDAKYQELFTRWFQFGAFCPMFRVHGTSAPKELWRWDEATQKIWGNYVDLRYRLLPYIYSVSWQVTSDGSTMMRPLMMDFPGDPAALDVGDQYLFGPAVMVCPVTAPGATNRSVYLPGTNAWYDFWTGKSEAGGRRVDAAAPIETMPLFVRAGAIVPMGPIVQYAAEKPAAPLEIRVYRGANGTFTLYDDEGDNYNYEKGKYSTIPLTWDDAAGTLTIGPRRGTFPHMTKTRIFRVVFVGDGHGQGVPETGSADRTVEYTGKPLVISPGGPAEKIRNDKVLVVEQTLAPGETLSSPDGRAGALVCLNAGQAEFVPVSAGLPWTNTVQRGEVVSLPSLNEPAARIMKNAGSNAMQIVLTTYLGNGGPETWSTNGLAPNYRVLFENQYGRVYEIRMAAGASEPLHSHHDRVIVCLSGAELQHVQPDGRTENATLKTGEITWRPATTHVGHNLGKTDLWLIAIEPK